MNNDRPGDTPDRAHGLHGPMPRRAGPAPANACLHPCHNGPWQGICGNGKGEGGKFFFVRVKVFLAEQRGDMYFFS